MALHKTYTLKGISIVDAYHKIKENRIGENYVLIIIGIYKDQASSSNEMNEITEKRYLLENIESGDQNFIDYVLTPHATDNILKRIQKYLIEKESDYTGATEV